MLATPKAKPLLEWCEANKPSLFISAESLTEISAAIGKMSATRRQRGGAPRIWFDEITTRFADRIHPVDVAIAIRAGGVLPSLTNSHPRHRFHDALLGATAQLHGHGLITRREGTFGRWTKVPIATV
jgi:predicted nucleic acid-binding protein